MSEKVFARVVDGVIVETDVYDYQIVNRGHPFSMYVQAIEGIKPFISSYQKLSKAWVISGENVKIEYTAEDLSIQEILNTVNQTVGAQETVNVDNIDTKLISAVFKQVQKFALQQLDEFARSRLYDDLYTLTTYATSKNEIRRSEGQRGVDLRDQVWDYLISLENRIREGKVGFPKTAQEILSQLPKLTWDIE